RLRRQRPANSKRRPSGVTEVGQALLVDAEVVGQLVEDGDSDLVLEQRRVMAEVGLQRAPVDGDLGRHVRSLLEEAEQPRFVRILLLDHDRDVLEPARQVDGEGVERLPDSLLECGRHHVGCSGRRFFTRLTVRKPNANPPMWAKTATPPVWSGCVRPTPPCQICSRIQIPRNHTAGISRKMKKKMRVRTRARGSRTK